jgi:uncharacterized protein
MLRVDLRQLQQKRRLVFDQAIALDDQLWRQSEIRLPEPLRVRLEAQYAGRDVVVRGELSGKVRLPCRRCLTEVTAELDEEVAWVFRAGLSQVEAEASEIYTLPERGDELELADPIREQVILAVPQYAICRDDCRGLCPRCGTNLNEEQCDCEPVEMDFRWAALSQLRTD